MTIRQLTKFLHHYFGTRLASEEACALRVPSSYLEDGAGMFELVIRDENHRLIPGSARIADIRSLEIGAHTDYLPLNESLVCLPIASPLVEQGAIIRVARAMVELLPSWPDEYVIIRDHGECPTNSVDRITYRNVTEIHIGSTPERRSPRLMPVTSQWRMAGCELRARESRENIAIGYWRCAYIKEDCS